MNFEVLSDETEEVQPVNIVVVGCGGGGCNAVSNMIDFGIRGVRFIAVNTDLQHLKKKQAETKLQIGAKFTQGRGAGGKPEVGEKAAMEDQERIAAELKDADMVFVTAGMGGGTGTGSAPVIAQIAKRMGALTVAVVTRPFEFEGPQRKKLAEDGIEKLRNAVDALIVIPNEKLLAMVDRRTPVVDTFIKADDVLRQSVQAISNLILETGIINIDFADAEAIMRDQGDTLMSIADGDGDNRASLAAKKALDNPLLEDTSIKGATKVLIYVAGNTDMAMAEYQEVVSTITADVDENAEIKAGLYIDPSLEDKIRVTVIATGFATGIKKQAEKTQSIDCVKEDKGDYIKEDEFKKMIGGNFQPRRNNYQEDDLDVPTYLRDKKFSGNISVMPRAVGKEA